MRNRLKRPVLVIGLVLAFVAGGAATWAATTGTTATCTQHPAVTQVTGGSQIKVTCTVPNPPAATVTKTVTASPSTSPSPTVTPSPTDTPTPTPTDPPSSSTPSPTSTAGTWTCTTSDKGGRCGLAWDANSDPWCNTTQVDNGVTSTQGTNGGCVYTDQNEWGPVTGEKQTLNANGPSDWQIVSNTPFHSDGAVTTFPNTGSEFNEQPLSSYSTVQATVDETMPHNSGTSGWATMDDWFDNWKYEVMIQHDFTQNGGCDYKAVQDFGGQHWGLCLYGSELIWKTAAAGAGVGDQATVNVPKITIDIKAMVQYLVDHGYMDPNPTITNLSDGFEVCYTSGVPETFQVNGYTLKATP